MPVVNFSLSLSLCRIRNDRVTVGFKWGRMTHIREIRSEKMAGFRSGEFKSSGSDGAVLRCPSRLTSSISIRVASVVADRRGFYRLRGKKKERRKERKGERFVSELKNTTDWLHNLKWQRKGKNKLRRRPRDSIYHLFIIERSISGSFPIFIRRAPSPPNFCSQR